MLQKILFVLLFILPFIILPIGASHFETGKVVIGEILIIIFVLLTLHRYEFKRKDILRLPNFFLLIIFLLSVLHIFFYDAQFIFFGNAFRLQGVFLLWLLILFAFFSSRVALSKVSETIIIVLFLLQLLAAMFLNVSNDGRGVGTLGEPNSLAGFSVFLWPFLFLNSLAKGKKKFILRAVGTSLALLIVIFSGSRSGMIALVVEMVFVFLVFKLKWTTLKAFFIAFLIFLLSLTLPFFQTDTVYENRAEIWQTAVYAGYEHPILGWGFGNTETAFKEYNEKLYNRLRGYYIDSSHNIFLDMWIQGGFIGLSAFVVLTYYAIRTFIRDKRNIQLCLLLGLLIVLSFNPVSVVILIQFWYIVGSTGKRNPTKNNEKNNQYF